MSIDITHVSGQVYLPLITQREIQEKLLKIKDLEVRKKINILHLGAVKILIKAQFKAGINTPIKMALIDNRINDRRDCILGAAKGNLAYSKFMFTVYPKFGISLNTENLDQVLSFIHQFERSDLMNKGDKVFSITYLIGYALSNSHHSIDYKNNPNIELDDVFQEIGNIEESQFCEITEAETDWVLDIAKDKPMLNHKNPTRRNSFSIGESSRKPADKLSLRSMSKRIDDLGGILRQLTD